MGVYMGVYGSWQNWAAPLLVPSFLIRIFGHATSSKKVVFFLNARRFCYAKITFLFNEMTRTGSGKFFKRKSMVLGPVLAYFPNTNAYKLTLICKGKKAKTDPKTINFRFKKIPDPVRVISPNKMLFLHSRIFWRSKKTPLFSMKWCDQKFES